MSIKKRRFILGEVLMNIIKYTEEVLNGEKVYLMPRPTEKHQYYLGRLHNYLGRLHISMSNFFEDHRCHVYIEIDVHLTDEDWVVPDLCVICDRTKFEHGAYKGIPELMVEILSPSTRIRDLGYKKDLYARVGVKEYWIVDGQNKSIDKYELKGNVYILTQSAIYVECYDVLTKEEQAQYTKHITSTIFPKLEIDVLKVFKQIRQ